MTSICLAFSYLLYRLLLAKLTFFQWNRVMLLSLSLLSCVLPLLSFSSPSWDKLNPLEGFPLVPFTSSEVVAATSAVDTVSFTFSEFFVLLYVV